MLKLPIFFYMLNSTIYLCLKFPSQMAIVVIMPSLAVISKCFPMSHCLLATTSIFSVIYSKKLFTLSSSHSLTIVLTELFYIMSLLRLITFCRNHFDVARFIFLTLGPNFIFFFIMKEFYFVAKGFLPLTCT